MCGQNIADDGLRSARGIVVANADGKIGSASGIGAVVDDDALVDGGVGDLHVVAVQSEEERAAGVQIAHDPFILADPHQIPHVERVADAQEKTGEEVLRDVPKGKAEDEAENAGTTQHRQSQARQPGDL